MQLREYGDGTKESRGRSPQRLDPEDSGRVDSHNSNSEEHLLVFQETESTDCTTFETNRDEPIGDEGPVGANATNDWPQSGGKYDSKLCHHVGSAVRICREAEVTSHRGDGRDVSAVQDGGERKASTFHSVRPSVREESIGDSLASRGTVGRDITESVYDFFEAPGSRITRGTSGYDFTRRVLVKMAHNVSRRRRAVDPVPPLEDSLKSGRHIEVGSSFGVQVEGFRYGPLEGRANRCGCEEKAEERHSRFGSCRVGGRRRKRSTSPVRRDTKGTTEDRFFKSDVHANFGSRETGKGDFDSSQHKEECHQCPAGSRGGRNTDSQDIKACRSDAGSAAVPENLSHPREDGIRVEDSGVDPPAVMTVDPRRYMVARRRKGLLFPTFPVHISAPEKRGTVWVSEVAYGTDAPRIVVNTTTGGRHTLPQCHSLGDLDPICDSALDYQALRKEFPNAPGLEVLRWLEDYGEFKKLLPPTLSREHRRSTSRHMLRHWNDLMRYGVAEGTDVISGMSMNLFTVEKKNGRLRLVMDCRKLNALMPRPRHMPIPTIHQVIDTMLGAKFFCTVDAKSYFYQFMITDPRIRDYFGFHVGAARGYFKRGRLRKLPMGWSYAPLIAQTISNILISGIPGSQVWLDNFVFTADSEKELRERFEIFNRRAKAVHLVLDSNECEVRTTGEVLGIHFDLTQARFKMSDSWAQKLQAGLEGLTAATPTARSLFQILGALIWNSYARREALCTRASAIDLARHAAELAYVSGWDTPVPLFPLQSRDLTDWCSNALLNEWSFAPPAPLPPEVVIWSDASDFLWAYLADDLSFFDQGSFPAALQTAHIFLKEAHAAFQGIRRATDLGFTSIHILTDNTALMHALNRRYSSSPFVNHLMSQTLATVTASYVHTTLNRADPYTRGILFSTDAPGGSGEQQQT